MTSVELPETHPPHPHQGKLRVAPIRLARMESKPRVPHWMGLALPTRALRVKRPRPAVRNMRRSR
eukprot:9081647-Alexandrium_andersonii.AAC.1